MPWVCGVKATVKPDLETGGDAQRATRVVVTGPATLLLQFAAAALGAQHRRGDD
jgi:hypothetical protein